MSYWLHPEAEAELGDAAVYYAEHANKSIASAFVTEFERVLALLVANQHLGSPADAGLRVYRQANAHMQDGVRRLGIGSLAWLIEEQQVLSDEIVPFIARPEHNQLREDFFNVLSPTNAEAVKAQLEQYLRAQGT